MAIDVGSVRIGVAVCDSEAILSFPLDAIQRSATLEDTVRMVSALALEEDVIEIYIGEPLSLSGRATDSTLDSRNVAFELARTIAVPVRLIDERFTTVTAASKLRASGKTSRSSKELIDSASAVEILESALNTEKASGSLPGILVGDSVGA